VDNVLKILSPGPLTTVQDAGRFGWMASGFSPSGAMDLPAARTANLLAGNPMDFPVLEMTLVGIQAEFGCDAVIALTGADMAAVLDGEELPRCQAVAVRAGQVLACGAAREGCRGYLALAGGFALEPEMGSCSTNLKCGLGGFEGRKLRAGDELPLREAPPFFGGLAGRRAPVPDFPPPEETIALRVLPGPQDGAFTAEGLRAFYEGKYAVTPASDRMGIKLAGPSIEAKDGYDIISDGIAAGSVQVPASGQPIVMMADRQTTGGYAKIATVITADLPKLAQAKIGSQVRFRAAGSPREAQAAARREAQKLRRLEYRMLWQ
jgi:biotin-dependent carboxylase-like uncharacterized protein